MRAAITIATTITTGNGTQPITSRSRQASTGVSTLMFAIKPVYSKHLIDPGDPGSFIYIFGVKSTPYCQLLEKSFFPSSSLS
jgi:hypothetical protein